MFPQVQAILTTVTLLDIVDIALVAFVLYKLYMLIHDTRAVQVLKGLIVLVIGTVISRWLELHVVNWLLQKSMTVVLVALPVVFQPELRRALEQLGRGRLFRNSAVMNEQEATLLIGELVKSTAVLSRNKIGALIVIERATGLNDYIETGIPVDGIVSAEFLINIFIPNTPLHDGAVIVRSNRVMAAGCLLPLTEETYLSKELGTRHRAAIGITEQSDCIAVVVSEETGVISVAMGGKLVRHLDEEGLRERLKPLYKEKNTTGSSFLNWRSTSR